MTRTSSLTQIASLLGGTLRGDGSIEIRGVGSVEDAGPGQLAAVEDGKLLAKAQASRAAALLVNVALDAGLTRPRVVVPHPQIALNAVIEHLGLVLDATQRGVHPTAVVEEGAEVAADAWVGPYAVIGAGAQVGSRTQIHPHAVVGAGARLGERCVVHPHAVIGSNTALGSDVVIGATAVVGGTGFGFGFGPKGPVRLHHLGHVEIGDRTEIGAGVTIDRARFGVTRIGCDVKIDNQVHIAHNCTVGDGTVMAAQVGLAGTTRVGRRCLVGGQVGFAGHLTVADGCQIAAKSGVPGDLDAAGAYLGFWAKERGTALRELAAVAKLPAALKELHALQEEIAALRRRLEPGDSAPRKETPRPE